MNEISPSLKDPKWENFRKKPVVIQAIKNDKKRGINTLEGVMNADVGDWIIKGVSGEFYPCKPDIFKKTYEKAYICLMCKKADKTHVIKKTKTKIELECNRCGVEIKVRAVPPGEEENGN